MKSKPKPTGLRYTMRLSTFFPQEEQHSSLLDTVTCGENLTQNVTRVSELAPDYCVGCADYHIRYAAHRSTGIHLGIALDRPYLVELVRTIIRERAAATVEPIEIVIPGSSDTGILATCAHAAATLGVESLNRCRFTVFDLCRTPLLLCQEFAARHKFSLRTRQIDVLATIEPFGADLIVAHSIFRFLKQSDQVTALDKFGSWLVPGGRMIVSTAIRTGEPAEKLAELHKRTLANQKFREILAKGSLKMRESAEQIVARLDRSMGDSEGRPGEIHSLADARALFARSQLREISAQCLTWEIELAPGDAIRRDRVLATLCRGDEVVVGPGL